MDTLMKDVGYAARTLGKSPGFTGIAVLTLAIGIGACTAIFSVVNAVLLRPLPYSDAGRLVIVWGEMRTRSVNDWPFSPPDFRDLRLHATLFEDMAASTPGGRVPIGGDDAAPEQVRVAGTTPNLFAILGAKIAFGRDFNESDAQPQVQPPANPGAAPGPPPPQLPASVMLSHEFWQRRYGGDPRVVGRMIEFGNGRAQIVGVLAPDFELLFPPRANMQRADIWTAARINYDTASRNNVFLRVVGRLKPNVSLEEARTQVEAVASDLRQHFPLANSVGLHFHVIPMHEDVVSGVRPAILALMGAVVFVLLIACANVANLLIVRASARHRELAIRAAIGGSRWRLIRQMLAESLLLAAAGTLVGLFLASSGIQVLVALAPESLPRLGPITIDPRVLVFTIVAALVTAIACGVVPALRASRPDLMDVLRQSGGATGLRAGRVVRNTVVMTEVALSFVLLVGSGLMVRSFIALQRVNPGYDPNGVLTFFLPARGRDPGVRAAFMRQVQERLKAIPGVQGVSAASPLPLDGGIINGRWGTAAAQADPSRYRQATFHTVLPGYFETLRTPLIAGRTFTDADNVPDRKIIIIDDHLAAKAFPNQAAVGQRLLARITTPDSEWYEVVGVVAHQRHQSLATDGLDGIFITDAFTGSGNAARWIVRTSGDPNQIVGAVRAAIAEIDPKVPLAEVQPMTAYVDHAMAPTRFAVVLIGIFGAVAVVLAAVGLYGVLSTVVRQRTAEIGMRMVFGASRSTIFRLVVGEGLRLSTMGVVVGVLAALGLTRLIASLLVGVGAADPATFVTITALFFIIAALAAWVPAQRAATLDPSVALREE